MFHLFSADREFKNTSLAKSGSWQKRQERQQHVAIKVPLRRKPLAVKLSFVTSGSRTT